MDLNAGIRSTTFSVSSPHRITRVLGLWALISTLLLTAALECVPAPAAEPQPFTSLGAAIETTGPGATGAAADATGLLDQVRAEAARAKEELAAARSAAHGGTAETWQSQRRALLQLLEGAGERQIGRLIDLQDMQARCSQLEKEVSGWTGFAEPVPSPFLKKEEVRESIRAAEAQVMNLKSWQTVVGKIAVQRRKSAEALVVRLRQQDEKLEKAARGPDALIRLSAERELLRLQNRLALARLRGIDIEIRTVQAELREAGLRLQLARRQLQTLPARSPFSAADLETLRSKLANERQRLDEEVVKVLVAIQAAEGNERQARVAPSDPSAVAPAKNDKAGTLDAMQREKIDSLDFKLQCLNWIIEFLRLQEDIWQLRWNTSQASDRKDAVVAYDRIAKGEAELQNILMYVEQKRRDFLAGLSKPADDVESAEESAAWIEERRTLHLDQVASISRLLGTLHATQYLLDRWKEDLDERYAARSLADRLDVALRSLKQVVAAVWQFEFFAVQDTIEVDGQKISGKRSVTVGKVLTALGILVIGTWIAARLAYLAERVTVRRFGVGASHARIARRWILVAELVLLAALSLEVVHIPLTIFAFMGGAVAIGAGFGMQNLLKNLISGLMLLLERPFRPGDLVEVGGIRGRVIDIGMRSSQIRDGNGIETLIPNSTFIEQNVTNWTLSSQSVRIAVKVGVAYGSPAQEVTDLLLEVADRHGLVQDKPPPQVLLEDFASDALLFGLYVWIELSPEVDWRVVASDLRFMINKTMEGRGIVIAFPQRDIHLDPGRPLEVRVVGNGDRRSAVPHEKPVRGDSES